MGESQDSSKSHVQQGGREDDTITMLKKASQPKESQPVRARNEDDDGYDPYSDYHDRPVREPLFERDPWS